MPARNHLLTLMKRIMIKTRFRMRSKNEDVKTEIKDQLKEREVKQISK